MSAIPSNSDPRLEAAAASDDSIQRVHAGLLHTKPEPEPGGYALAPLLLLGLMSGLILGCCIFFVQNRGAFDPLVYNGHLNTKPGEGPVVLPPEQIIAKGKSLYAQTCIQCHMADGKGVPGKYPPLAGSDIVNGSEDRVIRILLHGLKDPITLNGATFTTSEKMPPFGPGMPGGLYNYSDAKISYVLSYVRSDFGNKSALVEESKVTEVHKQVAARTTSWTMSELPASP